MKTYKQLVEEKKILKEAPIRGKTSRLVRPSSRSKARQAEIQILVDIVTTYGKLFTLANSWRPTEGLAYALSDAMSETEWFVVTQGWSLEEKRNAAKLIAKSTNIWGDAEDVLNEINDDYDH